MQKGICQVANAPALIPIDGGVQYSLILPFADEWKNLIDDENHPIPSPFHMWFKCIDNQVRGYFMVEDMRQLSHGKEANTPTAFILDRHLFMYANGRPINIRIWLGGADFNFYIVDTEKGSLIQISIKGFKHYTYFDSNSCTEKKSTSYAIRSNTDIDKRETKYVMHIHLRQYYNTSHNIGKVIRGIANHAYYHRCALQLDRYEFVIHKEQAHLFLENSAIKKAVDEGWMRMIVRNPIIPAPIKIGHHPSNCYWQAYVENMALLRYWKEDVRMYFFDSDEYIWFADNVTTTGYREVLRNNGVVGFERYMTFCSTCSDKQGELNHFSFRNTQYKIVRKKLDHTKLVVDPNQAGCYIVHWAGCGPRQYTYPIEEARILHFENLYIPRWKYSHSFIQDTDPLTPSKVNLKCDPKLFL